MLILTLLSSLLIQTVLVNAQCGTLAANQICCNNKIKTIPSDNKGPACCGDNVYNVLKQICCNGVIAPLRSLLSTVCCGNVSMDTSINKCCNGVKHTPDYFNKKPACCASTLYDYEYKVCCVDKLYTPDSWIGPACCGDKYYETINAQCCNNQVISKVGWTKPGCCNNVPFNGSSSICCEGNLISTKYYGNPKCCGSNLIEGRVSTLCCGSNAYPFGDWTIKYSTNEGSISFSALSGYYGIVNGADIKNYILLKDKNLILIYDNDWNKIGEKSFNSPTAMLKVDNDIYIAGSSYFAKVDTNLNVVTQYSSNVLYRKIFYDSSSNQLYLTYDGNGVHVFGRNTNFIKVVSVPYVNGIASAIVKVSDRFYVGGASGGIDVYGNNFNAITSFPSGCSGIISELKVVTGCASLLVGCQSGEIYTISLTTNNPKSLFYSGYSNLRGFDLDPKGRLVIYASDYFYVKMAI